MPFTSLGQMLPRPQRTGESLLFKCSHPQLPVLHLRWWQDLSPPSEAFSRWWGLAGLGVGPSLQSVSAGAPFLGWAEWVS